MTKNQKDDASCAHRKQKDATTARYGWIRSTCADCGKFLGYRPVEIEQYYKQNRSKLKNWKAAQKEG